MANLIKALKNNSMTHLTVIMLCFTGITACGSAEEESINSNQASADNSAASNNTVTIATEENNTIAEDMANSAQANSSNSSSTSDEQQSKPITMDDLVADESFDFTHKTDITVQLNFTEYQDKRAYLSIYSQYNKIEDDVFFPVSTSRVLAGPLTNGVFNHRFAELTDTKTYLVELWFYDGTRPVIIEVEAVNQTLSI